MMKKQTESRSNRDDKIKASLLEGVETAKDARATVVTAEESAQAKWASKQSGL